MLANESSHVCSASSMVTLAQMSSTRDGPGQLHRLARAAAAGYLLDRGHNEITTVADSRANTSGHSLQSCGA